MSLRDGAVEAMAQVLSVEICGMDEGADEGCMADHRREGSAALTALLDFLGTHTEEWKGVYSYVLVAALRGTTEEGET